MPRSPLAVLAFALLGCHGTTTAHEGDGGRDATADAIADRATVDEEPGDEPTPVVCTAATCPSGCCTESGCLPGTDPTACGLGGAPCQNCVDDGLPNCIGQVCEMVHCAGCSAGCCDLSGACQVGSSNTACGAMGGPCSNCFANGQTCHAGACQ